MFKITTIMSLMLPFITSTVAITTPKVVTLSQEVYNENLRLMESRKSTSSIKRRDTLGFSCCPVNGVPQIDGIFMDDAAFFASDLSAFTFNIPAETCVIVDCSDDDSGIAACNFEQFSIEVSGTTFGAGVDFLIANCFSGGLVCGVVFDSTAGWNVWTTGNACAGE